MKAKFVCVSLIMLLMTGCGSSADALEETVVIAESQRMEKKNEEQTAENEITEENLSMSAEEAESEMILDETQWESASVDLYFGQTEYFYTLKKEVDRNSGIYKENFKIPEGVEDVWIYSTGISGNAEDTVTVLFDGNPLNFKLDGKLNQTWMPVLNKDTEEHSIELLVSDRAKIILAVASKGTEISDRANDNILNKEEKIDIRKIETYEELQHIQARDIFGQDKGFLFQEKDMAMNNFKTEVQFPAHADAVIYFIGITSGSEEEGEAIINIDGEQANFLLNGEIQIQEMKLQRDEGGFFDIKGDFSSPATFIMAVQEKRD